MCTPGEDRFTRDTSTLYKTTPSTPQKNATARGTIVDVWRESMEGVTTSPDRLRPPQPTFTDDSREKYKYGPFTRHFHRYLNKNSVLPTSKLHIIVDVFTGHLKYSLKYFALMEPLPGSCKKADVYIRMSMKYWEDHQ